MKYRKIDDISIIKRIQMNNIDCVLVRIPVSFPWWPPLNLNNLELVILRHYKT